MARMLTEPVDFSSHDVSIFLCISGLLPTHAGNWRGDWPTRGRAV